MVAPLSAVVAPAQGAAMPVINACELGRPVHLLGLLCQRGHEDMSAILDLYFAARQGPRLRLGELSHRRTSSPLREARWIAFDTPLGRIGFAAERPVVLALLASRHGLENWHEPDLSILALPETATEHRLAGQLGLRLMRALVARLQAGLDEPDSVPPVITALATRPGHTAPLGERAWQLHTTLGLQGGDVLGQLRFALEHSVVEQLLRRLAPRRHSRAPRLATGPALRQQLPLALHARLLEKRLPLGDVLDLRPGHVLPVDLNHASVRVLDTPLLNARVVEHKGKLCLTAFQEP